MPPGATAPQGARTGTGGGGATPPSSGSRSKRGLGLVAATVLLVGVAGGAWWALTAPGASATQVSLETVSSSGSLPFGAPAANDAVGVVAPDNAGGELAGNTSGLYARPAGAPPCDGAAIVSGVTSDPAKAAAWAAPLGIGAGDIPAFVGGLSPLTLRADTAVTQYGYGDGTFQPYPAVLQAGTAVLVNSFGEPTVKCHNANPLGPPTASNTDGETSGDAWPGYTVERTVTVVAASVAQSRFEVVDEESDRQEPIDCPPQTVPPKQNPTPPTGPDEQLLLTGVHNYDNTVTRSDGKIIRADGEIVKPAVEVVHPPGSTILKDGAIQHPDGRVFNVNGTERRPITVFGRTIGPDGVATPPLAPGTGIRFNYDGSVMLVTAGQPGEVLVFDGKGDVILPNPPIPPGSRVDSDGTVTTPEGKILNANGQQRPPKVVIPPGNVVLDDKGGNTPPIEQKATDEQDTQTGTKVQLGTAPGGGLVVEKGEGGELVPVPAQQVEQVPGGAVCVQAPCAPGQGTPGGPQVPAPVGGGGPPVVPVPGDTGAAPVPDCTTAPAGTAGCASGPAKPVEPAPGTGTGTTGSTTGGTTGGSSGGSSGGTENGTGTSGSTGGPGEGSSSTGSGSGGGSSGGEGGSGGN